MHHQNRHKRCKFRLNNWLRGRTVTALDRHAEAPGSGPAPPPGEIFLRPIFILLARWGVIRGRLRARSGAEAGAISGRNSGRLPAGQRNKKIKRRRPPRVEFALERYSEQIVRRVCGVIADETREWTERDVASCAAVLCAAALAGAGAGGEGGGAARALRALLDRRAREPHVRAAAAWRALGGAQRYAALQLAGRALAASPPPLRARPLRALAALAQPPSAEDRRRPDRLKVRRLRRARDPGPRRADRELGRLRLLCRGVKLN